MAREKYRAVKNETSRKGPQPGGHRADTQHTKHGKRQPLAKWHLNVFWGILVQQHVVFANPPPHSVFYFSERTLFFEQASKKKGIGPFFMSHPVVITITTTE